MNMKVIEDSVGPNGVRISTVQLRCSVNNYIDLLQHHELSITNQKNYEFCGLSLIITSTQWDDFLDKSPEYGDVKKALDAIAPTVLQAGEWHLPFVNFDSACDIIRFLYPECTIADKMKSDFKRDGSMWVQLENMLDDNVKDHLVRLSAARCYKYQASFGGSPSIEDRIEEAKDIRSLGLDNWSPFEHQAQAITDNEELLNIGFSIEANADSFGPNGIPKPFTSIPDGLEMRIQKDGSKSFWSRNFKNWIQACTILSKEK